MAMKRVSQKDVTWVKKDPKTGKGGFLALRSDKSKPFSGVVTGVQKGTTAASASGEAVYRGGKNIRKVASREAAKRAAVPRPSVTDRSKTTPAATKGTKPTGRKVNNMTLGIKGGKTYSRTSGRAVERGLYKPPGLGSQFGKSGSQSIAQLEAMLSRMQAAASARKRSAQTTAAQKAAAAAEQKRIAELKAAIQKAKG